MADQIPIWQRIQEIKHEIGGDTISIERDMCEGDITLVTGNDLIEKNRKVCALLQEAEDLMTPKEINTLRLKTKLRHKATGKMFPTMHGLK